MKLKHRCVKDLEKNFVSFALWTAAWLSKHMRRHPVTLTICLSSSARSFHSEPFCADLRTSHHDGRAQIKWNWSTETLKDSCFSTRPTTQFAPTQWKCFQFQRWHTGLEAKKCWSMAGVAESIVTQRALSHLKSVEQVDVDLSRIWTKTLWLLPSERQHGCPKAFVRNADHLRVKFGMKSAFGTRQNWNCSQPPYGKEQSLPCMWSSICRSKIMGKNDFDSDSIAPQEKGQCWSTMSATSLQNMRTAVTTSPDSNTWCLERAFGNI